MSLKPTPIPPVPEDTARVARAVFPGGNIFMRLRDTLGTIYTDEAFADLFPTHGQPGSCTLASGIDHDLPMRPSLAAASAQNSSANLSVQQNKLAVDRQHCLKLRLLDTAFDCLEKRLIVKRDKLICYSSLCVPEHRPVKASRTQSGNQQRLRLFSLVRSTPEAAHTLHFLNHL